MAVLLSLLLPVLACVAAADFPLRQDEQKGARVEITQSVGPPGGRVAVPIRLVGTEAERLGAITVTLRFPSESLTFEKVEIGGLGESVAATADVATEKKGTDVVLQVTLATPADAADRQPLPDGPVAQVLFTVAKTLKPESVIRLAVEARGVSLVPGARPAVAASKEAQVIVSKPSVISCFFYMH